MGRENGEAGARGLVLVRSAQRPEGNWAAAELREPALELRLRGVVGQAGHVQDLAALRQESPHISTSIHGTGEHIGVLVGRLGLVDQSAQDASKGDGLLHGAAWGRWCQGLQVERQVVLDGGAGGDGLNLERGTDVGEHGWPEWQGFGVVLLPSLVLGAEVECAGVLEVWWQDDGLVAGLTGKLDAEIPRVEGDEREVEVLRGQVLGGECVEAGDGITESARIADVLPRQCCQAGWRRGDVLAIFFPL